MEGESPQEIKLTLKSVKGGTSELVVSPNALVSDVKKQIAEMKNIEVDTQKLICRGKHLADDKRLSDYKIKEKDSIILMILRKVIYALRL